MRTQRGRRAGSGSYSSLRRFLLYGRGCERVQGECALQLLLTRLAELEFRAEQGQGSLLSLQRYGQAEFLTGLGLFEGQHCVAVQQVSQVQLAVGFSKFVQQRGPLGLSQVAGGLQPLVSGLLLRLSGPQGRGDRGRDAGADADLEAAVDHRLREGASRGLPGPVQVRLQRTALDGDAQAVLLIDVAGVTGLGDRQHAAAGVAGAHAGQFRLQPGALPAAAGATNEPASTAPTWASRSSRSVAAPFTWRISVERRARCASSCASRASSSESSASSSE